MRKSIMKEIRIKRVYEPANRQDGYRVLVDRLWPRGLKKSKAAVDLWMKDIAPSSELRKWFAHEPQKWGMFKRKYFRELSEQEKNIDWLIQQGKKRRVTLLFSAKDEKFNNAVALKEYLEKNLTE